jgi:hypothetical protein
MRSVNRSHVFFRRLVVLAGVAAAVAGCGQRVELAAPPGKVIDSARY